MNSIVPEWPWCFVITKNNPSQGGHLLPRQPFREIGNEVEQTDDDIVYYTSLFAGTFPIKIQASRGDLRQSKQKVARQTKIVQHVSDELNCSLQPLQTLEQHNSFELRSCCTSVR